MYTSIKSAFSNLELLIVLSLMSALSFIGLSMWKQVDDNVRLMHESQQVTVFLTQLKQQAIDYQNKWELWGYQEANSTHWCLLAKPSQSIFMPDSCTCSAAACKDFLIYNPIEKSELVIPKNDSFYLITLFNGIRGRSKSNHFALALEKQCQKFIFNDRLTMRLEKGKC